MFIIGYSHLPERFVPKKQSTGRANAESMDRRVRLAGVALCLLLAVGLCVGYGASYENGWPYPTGDELADEPAGWDGERVLLFGEVRERTTDGLVMSVENDAGEVVREVSVHGTGVRVERGGVVQVYGQLSERGSVQTAESVVVVNRSPADSLYKLATSALGGVGAALFFLRYWRIDWRRVRFERRGGEDG